MLTNNNRNLLIWSDVQSAVLDILSSVSDVWPVVSDVWSAVSNLSSAVLNLIDNHRDNSDGGDTI